MEGKRGRAQRRHDNVTKALRKKHLSDSFYPNGDPWYDNLHQYSKNKIHCSCAMCRGMKYRNEITPRDRKRIDKLEEQLNV